MILTNFNVLLFVIYFCCATVSSTADFGKCEVRTRIDSGWVCGVRRLADNDVEYASFRGIPYAEQPVGELRFKELQPARPWPYHLDATEEGPICPQHDEIYERLVQPDRGMSEACIYVNVHTPMEALDGGQRDQNEYHTGYMNHKAQGLPIFVFVHGGSFQAGSGNTDLHGPEYLISKGIIVITFNYRLNVFGFLSLNNPKIPGNAGLRDQVTLLRWVQRNARAFGGDPSEVTLAGQSAGATCVHLLTLSATTKGLFKRAIIMSGTAIPAFYTTSPIYANLAAARFLSLLGINSTDPDVIHGLLVNIPLERILKANSIYQYETGVVSFMPVVEPKYPGVTRILDDDPINLMKLGRGKEYPMIVGFANEECEFLKNRLVYFNILNRIENNPLLILPFEIPFTTAPNVALKLAKKMIDWYFHGKLNIDRYLDTCRDTYFEHPSFKVAEWRAETKYAAPVYLYQFSYESDFNVVKAGMLRQYKGSAHLEDMTFIFRENAILGDKKPLPAGNRDSLMKDWMTQFVINFIRCNAPACEGGWHPVHAQLLNYQDINEPGVFINRPPTHEQWATIKFLDTIYETARNSSVAPPNRESTIEIDTSS